MPISPIEGVNMMLHSITSPAALVPLAYIVERLLLLQRRSQLARAPLAVAVIVLSCHAASALAPEARSWNDTELLAFRWEMVEELAVLVTWVVVLTTFDLGLSARFARRLQE